MSHLVLIVLATFLVWELVLAVAPIKLPSWLSTALVVGAAYGIAQLPDNPLLVPIAAAGGVALLHRWALPEVEKPSTLPRRLRPGRRADRMGAPGVGNRIPKI